MHGHVTYFITWTTYGAWLPGDARGWRKRRAGVQRARPLLEEWSRHRMAEPSVLLNQIQRVKVEDVCREHSVRRGWALHAISARSNHVHLAVTCSAEPDVARDQFKANATRVLRQDPDPLANERVWTNGGDTEVVDGDDALEQVIQYITAGQEHPRL